MGAKGLARGRSHAIRPWPDWEAYEGEDGAANETLAVDFWQNCGTDAIEISGIVVESRWQSHNFLTLPGGTTWMASTACSDACLPLSLHAKPFSVSRALAAHVTAPLSSGRAARSRRKSQLGYFLFGSVARLPGVSVRTQTACNGTNGHE